MNLSKKSVVEVLAFLIAISLRFHKVDRKLGHSSRRQKDAVDRKVGLLDFLRAKPVGAGARVSIADQLKKGTGGSLEELVEN